MDFDAGIVPMSERAVMYTRPNRTHSMIIVLYTVFEFRALCLTCGPVDDALTTNPPRSSKRVHLRTDRGYIGHD